MPNSYSGTIPVCQMYFVNNLLNLSLRSIYSSGTTSSLLSVVLAEFPLEKRKSDLWTPTGTGSGVPVSSPMVHLFQDNPSSSPTEYRTGPVLFHGCLFDRMGSQLERLPHLAILDYRAPGGFHINWLEMEAVRLAVLHWCSQWQGQTLRLYSDNSTTVADIREQGDTIFRDSVHQNSGTVKAIGSSSH